MIHYFTRHDGELDKATITARRSKLGYRTTVKVGLISKTFDVDWTTKEDALLFGVRGMELYKELNVI